MILLDILNILIGIRDTGNMLNFIICDIVSARVLSKSAFGCTAPKFRLDFEFILVIHSNV